jgi:LmbE family N-acetylglucosaminyl deacetylase
MMNIEDADMVLRRPHFQLKAGVLYFMASRRPFRVLYEAELKLWSAIEAPTSMGMLRERFPKYADAVIGNFWRSELCDIAEQNFPAGRRRVLVIEPHADDAALSIGGTMWQRRRECEFIVATLASRSNYTSYFDLARDYFDVAQVTEIRRRESELFARMLGGRSLAAGLTDIALRYRDTDWSLDYFRRHRTSILTATSRSADGAIQIRWKDAVRRLLAETRFDEVWIPLGGPHSDHQLTTDACIAGFVSDPTLIAGRALRLYQDVPYASRRPEFTGNALAALERAGVRATGPEIVDVNRVFEQKLRLISVYASQFKVSALRADIEASAKSHGRGNFCAEQLWTIKAMPDQLAQFGIGAAAINERKQESAVAAWLARNRDAARVRVLLLAPTGQWARDLELLRHAFPRTRLDILYSSAAAAEVVDAAVDGVELHEVGAGARAWGMKCLRLAANKPMPTLFHTGERRLRSAALLSKTWALSDTLVVASMNPVVRALAQLLAAEEAARGIAA